MLSFLRFSTLAIQAVVVAAEFAPCPILGPWFPKPTSLLTSPAIKSGLQDLTDILDSNVATGNGTHGPTTPNTTSFSIVLFSTAEGSTLPNEPFFYEYHHTAPTLRNATTGVNTVDKDSIYRIGDLTQIFTVWTFLNEVGDASWDEPVTKYVPELATAPKGDRLDFVDWHDVRLGDLAGQLAGIARDYGEDDLSLQGLDFEAIGFPKANGTRKPPCGGDKACSRKKFFDGLTKRAPVVLPASTPIFSDAAFQILAYALETKTNKKYDSMLEKDIIKPLAMTHTSLQAPKNSTFGVVPGDEKASGWQTQLGDAGFAKGIYTSISDLARAGTSILSSSLLSPSQTRRWLKPITHTSNSANSIGRPWEIYSGKASDDGTIMNVYTKLGTFGKYSSYIGLVSDYNVGFAILAADSVSAPDLNSHADIIGDALLPALIKAAARQAVGNSAGVFEDGNCGSMEIGIDGLPGFNVKELKRKNVDVRASIAKLKGIQPDALSFRLVPTGLESGGRIAFRAIWQDENEFADVGTSTCVSWMDVDKLVYGSIALDLFVFDVDKSGKVLSVEVPALEMKLVRKG